MKKKAANIGILGYCIIVIGLAALSMFLVLWMPVPTEVTSHQIEARNVKHYTFHLFRALEWHYEQHQTVPGSITEIDAYEEYLRLHEIDLKVEGHNIHLISNGVLVVFFDPGTNMTSPLSRREIEEMINNFSEDAMEELVNQLDEDDIIAIFNLDHGGKSRKAIYRN